MNSSSAGGLRAEEVHRIVAQDSLSLGFRHGNLKLFLATV